MRILILTLLSLLLNCGTIFAQETSKENNEEHIQNQNLKNREEGRVTSLIKSLDLINLKERLIKEANATDDDFEKFMSFFEFNLKFYILELKSKVEEPDFNKEKFDAFVGQKFRESLFEFKRFLQEDKEFRSRIEKTQYDQLYNTVYKINPHQHTPNEPMAAGQPCQNMDFANNTSNWVGNYCRGLGWSDINDAQCWNGFGNGQYTKMTGGNDGNFGAIPRVPPGSGSSLRLGDTGPNNDKATIWQTFRVSQNNYIFVYKWAAVLDNNGNHSAATSPYFKVRMYRNFGTGSQQEISCATVNANSQTANSWGFSSSGGYRYKNWTTMFIPLDAYIGQDITIWFETSDCMVDGGTHEGYAYIWASCLPPTFTMSKPALCSGGTLTITAPAGADNYSWSSSPPGAIQGSTSGQTITATQGNATYYVTMTTNTQPPYTPCSITLDTLVSGSSGAINPNFSPADACQGSPTTFTDLSTPAAQITSWSWDFNNDGTPDATTQNPTYTFPSAGSFPVKLSISNGSCPKDTIINVNVLPNPTANFTVNPVCVGATSIFTNTSTPPTGGTITGNDWEFGDGNSSSANNPTNLYASAGTYNVTLITTADNGCTSTITKPATVNSLPNVDAGPFQNFCLGGTTTLSGSGANTYSWSNSVSNGISFSPTITNTYTVTGTDANGCVNTDTVSIRVNPVPLSDFNATNVCLNNANTFTNSSSISSGSITNYNWDFGDSNTANTQNTSHTYISAGTYQVKLIVTSNMNCTDTITKSVVVYSLPNVVATSPDHEICLKENTSISASGANTYTWTPSTFLNSSTNTNITLNPTSTITYTLTGTDANNCVNTDTVNIIVNPLPVADFTSTNACFNQQQNTFTDASTISSGTITNWGWNFNNNESNSTTQNPSYQFNSDGTKNVSLIVTSAKGCKDTVSKNTLVYTLPNADFNVQNVCIGFNVQLNNISSNGTGSINSNTWQFGDGNTSNLANPSHNYAAPNTYTIQLNVSDNNNCKDSTQKQVTVHPLPNINAITTDPYICLNESTNLNATGGNTYTWSSSTQGNFSSNQNTSVSPSSTVTYTVTSADNNGCINTDTVNVIVNPLPVANFSGTNACLNQQSNQLTDLSNVSSGNINNWNWTTAGQSSQTIQNPLFTFTTSGIKNIELIVTTNAGCKDTISKTVEVYVLPTAIFTNTSVCKGVATTFTNNSTNGSGTINSIFWDLGDGTNSTQNNPSHTYINDGNYTVNLYISDSNGCKDTIQQNLTVYPLPVVSFNATSVCALKPTTLSGTSTISSGNITNWEWHLNSDNVADAITATTTYTYTSGGSYPVKLVNTSNQGCKDSLTKNINVNFIPVADFTNINKCLYDSIPFTNQSSVAQGTIASYDWIFGDGGISSNTNPYHTYTSCGVKAVTLVSTSDSGCVNALTKQITVFCKPTANLVTADVCANITANFSGLTSISTDGTISAYSWNFGNGQSSSSSTANVNYLAGNYNVTLIVQSNNGCLDTTIVPIEIFPVPSAGFNVNDSCFGTSTCFTNTSVLSSGNILNYCWDFNTSINTCESTNTNPCYIFPAVGSYNTTLITTSDKGCLDTITKTHKIFPLPVVNFSGTDVCIGNVVNFTNNTTISSGSINSYSWNFGNNQTSSATNPSNDYLNSGIFPVSLIALSDKGCKDSLKKTVNVYPKPEANFESNLFEGCEPLCVNLNNLSTTNNNPPNSIAQYFWEASNGWSSNSNSPTNVCFAAGDYDVKLTIISDKGCSDTISFINYLHSYPLPIADFNFSPNTTTILQSSITFVDKSNGGKTISWDFGDNDTTYVIEGENLIHTYADTGEYIVTQVVVSEYGCVDSIKKTVIIGPDWTFYIPNAFTPNEDGINDFYNGKGYGIKEYALIIFDRWGNLIARVDDINSKGWNGTVEPYSEPCQIDTYVYRVALTDVFDKRHYYTGTFHLVR